MPGESDPVSVLSPFFAKGLITKVQYAVKSGKEATVYCCQAHPSTGAELLAAKVYRGQQMRSFKNDAIYQQGRTFGKARETRAYLNKSRFGREVQFHTWVAHEWEVLNLLHKAGGAVPRPYAMADAAILMEYAGDANGPAAMLSHVSLEPTEAKALFDLVIGNITLWLGLNIVHADLSPYNILYWQGQARIIDFPQAVDARVNLSARQLLARDISNVCTRFARYGIPADPTRILNKLWARYMRGNRISMNLEI
jgi:RIO kinase 1